MSPTRPVLIPLLLAVSASHATTVALPLDHGEWLASGIAVWVSRELGSDGYLGEIVSSDIAPGDLTGMCRAAANLGLERILVVNCGYLEARVLVELFLFDTEEQSLSGYWRGLINYDALALELPFGLKRILETDGFDSTEQPDRFLDERWEDYLAFLDR